jgi:mono/diheme cytochrome c family protein
MITPLLRTFAAAAAVMLIHTASTSAQDVRTDFEPTANEFRNSCASCHGDDAKGAGWLTRLFKGIDPGDLTQLAKNNDGQFPFDQVFQVIDGRAEMAAHGPRKMPVWGDRYLFKGQCGTECGPDEMNQLRARARSRILELVYYIQSIQQR